MCRFISCFILIKNQNGTYNYRVESHLNPFTMDDDDCVMLSDIYHNVSINDIRKELNKHYKCSSMMYVKVRNKDSFGKPLLSKRICLWYYLDDDKMLEFCKKEG